MWTSGIANDEPAVETAMQHGEKQRPAIFFAILAAAAMSFNRQGRLLVTA